MSKVKIQGNASGTGVLTITAPNTSTDRTITLPDSTGTLATTADTGVAGITSSADATAITIDSSERVGIGAAPASGIALTISKDGTGADLAGIRLIDSNSGNDQQIYNYQGNLYFRDSTAGVTRLRVDADGLKFGNDTAAANALDDYEYGTWTPANQWITLTNNETARYVKIGSLVTVWGNVTWASSPADTSQTGGKIQGLPYTPVGGDFPWLPSHWVNTTTGARKDDSEYDYYLSTDTTMIIYSRPNSRVLQRQQVSGTQMKFIATFTTD
jgi:hypothetical protein